MPRPMPRPRRLFTDNFAADIWQPMPPTAKIITTVVSATAFLAVVITACYVIVIVAQAAREVATRNPWQATAGASAAIIAAITAAVARVPGPKGGGGANFGGHRREDGAMLLQHAVKMMQ